jgi:hypothetical protein
MLTPALAQDFNEGRRKTQTIESLSRFPEQVFSFSVQCISVQCEPNNIQHLRAAIQASANRPVGSLLDQETNIASR